MLAEVYHRATAGGLRPKCSSQGTHCCFQCGNRMACAGRFMRAFLEAFDAREWNGFKRDWFNQRAFNKCLSMPFPREVFVVKGSKLQELKNFCRPCWVMQQILQSSFQPS